MRKYTDCDVISIARWSPKWFTGEECKILAPSANLLERYRNGITNSDDYTKEYTAYLDSLDLTELINNLTAREHDIVLCCYEKPTDFCHRHVLAEYCNKKYGTDIIEYTI